MSSKYKRWISNVRFEPKRAHLFLEGKRTRSLRTCASTLRARILDHGLPWFYKAFDAQLHVCNKRTKRRNCLVLHFSSAVSMMYCLMLFLVTIIWLHFGLWKNKAKGFGVTCHFLCGRAVAFLSKIIMWLCEIELNQSHQSTLLKEKQSVTSIVE